MSRTKPTFLLVAVTIVFVAVIGCSENQPVTSSRPVLRLSKSSLTFTALAGNNPDPVRQEVVVSNAGEGAMTFVATTSSPWISIGPEGSDTIFVTVISSSLPIGTYSDTISVTSTEAINSPLLLPVTLNVVDWIIVTPSSLEFAALSGGSNPDPQNVEISTYGGDQITYSASTAASWIDFANPAGAIPGTLEVNVDVSGLATGMHVDSIIITSPELSDYRLVVPCMLTLSSWIEQSLDPSYRLEGVVFFDANTGWVSGYLPSGTDLAGVVFRTTNGGNNWSGVMFRPGVILGGIACINADIVWAAGDSARLVHTIDGGDHWSVRRDLPLDSTRALWDVTFICPDSGWAVGSKGTVIRTVDSGATWSVQSVSTNLSVHDACFVSDLSGWIVGDHGNIYHTADGGASWTKQNSNTIEDLQAVDFIDQSNGWVVGRDGMILHTTDGGISWNTQTSGVAVQLADVEFVNLTHGWAVGRTGTILHTDDGGTSWLPQSSGTTRDLFSVFFLDSDVGWVVGDGGVLLKTASGGF